MFELKERFTPAEIRDVLGQLNDRVLALWNAQPTRRRVVVFCAATSGIQFWVAEDLCWVAKTAVMPWSAESAGMLRRFLSLSAAEHGFVVAQGREAQALQNSLDAERVIRGPSPGHACILVVRGCVVKAHADASRRDGERTALLAMSGVRGVPQVVDGETQMAEQCYLLWMRPVASTLESQPFSAELFRAVVTTCTSVLVEAHKRRLVHRDVSPGNILCGADGSVTLNDWGSARVVGTPAVLDGTTPAFSRPLLCSQRAVEPLDDWWSLLFVLYRFSAFARAPRLDELGDEARVGTVALAACTNDIDLVRPEARPVVAALFQKVTSSQLHGDAEILDAVLHALKE